MINSPVFPAVRERVDVNVMGWLRLVGSSKLWVSFAEYSLFYRAFLQKRPNKPAHTHTLYFAWYEKEFIRVTWLFDSWAFVGVRSLIRMCDKISHVAVCFSVLQCLAVCCSNLQCVAVCDKTPPPRALYHTATLCNTLQHTATHCNTLQHTATHCNTL